MLENDSVYMHWLWIPDDLVSLRKRFQALSEAGDNPFAGAFLLATSPEAGNYLDQCRLFTALIRKFCEVQPLLDDAVQIATLYQQKWG